VLTLFSMTKIWAGVFWGTPNTTERRITPRGMALATATLVAVSLVIAVAAEPIVSYAERAANDLVVEGIVAAMPEGVTP
ncbi:MAG: hypothetical protein WBO21_12370, partial [Acidimicrobiia bacterium]